LITLWITPSIATGVQVENVSIGLTNCQSLWNKYNGVADVDEDMDIDSLFMKYT